MSIIKKNVSSIKNNNNKDNKATTSKSSSVVCDNDKDQQQINIEAMHKSSKQYEKGDIINITICSFHFNRKCKNGIHPSFLHHALLHDDSDYCDHSVYIGEIIDIESRKIKIEQSSHIKIETVKLHYIVKLLNNKTILFDPILNPLNIDYHIDYAYSGINNDDKNKKKNTTYFLMNELPTMKIISIWDKYINFSIRREDINIFLKSCSLSLSKEDKIRQQFRILLSGYWKNLSFNKVSNVNLHEANLMDLQCQWIDDSGFYHEKQLSLNTSFKKEDIGTKIDASYHIYDGETDNNIYFSSDHYEQLDLYRHININNRRNKVDGKEDITFIMNYNFITSFTGWFKPNVITDGKMTMMESGYRPPLKNQYICGIISLYKKNTSNSRYMKRQMNNNVKNISYYYSKWFVSSPSFYYLYQFIKNGYILHDTCNYRLSYDDIKELLNNKQYDHPDEIAFSLGKYRDLSINEKKMMLSYVNYEDTCFNDIYLKILNFITNNEQVLQKEDTGLAYHSNILNRCFIYKMTGEWL